ncbi:alanine glycine permease [Spirochaetia bacterium]|nr:alanine glycine permease [Spirochaetia bacterium]
MDILLNFFNAINGVFWGNFMVFVLVGTGIFFSFRLGFPQILKIKDSFLLVFGNLKSGEKADKKGMTSWQSLATAVAGQVGTGNIVGPATAILAGGPGAVFWVWLSAFFGMGTIFSEATAAQKYKSTLKDGSVTGGPSFYIKAAFPNTFGKALAACFSVFTIVGFGMAAAMIQGNTVSGAMNNSFGIAPWITGAVLSLVLLLVAIGGMERIAHTVSTIVPIMAGVYMIFGLIIIIVNIGNLPDAIVSIFKGAFSPSSLGGGFVGISVRETMRYGVARGLFSNEAGLGSTPHAHAVAKVKHPCDQGLVAVVSIIIDTFIVLTTSCLIILTSKGYESGKVGIGVVQNSFESVFGGMGGIIITVTITLFCFSTIIAAYFYGLQNFKNLFGVKSVPVYIVLIIAFLMFGSVAMVELVWAFCDTFNGLMVFANLIGLFGVSNIIAKLWREYKTGSSALDTTLNDIKKRKAAE